MVTRWPALSTRVRVSRVGPLSASGVRSSRDPTLLAPHKISLWDTRLCVLGWDIDTVAMTISVPLEKLERLRDTLHEWSPDRVVASEEELRSLIGRVFAFV